MSKRPTYVGCAQCCYWESFDNADERPYEEGACKRLPPSGIPLSQETEDRSDGLAAFPMTYAHDWCGEFSDDWSDRHPAI